MCNTHSQETTQPNKSCTACGNRSSISTGDATVDSCPDCDAWEQLVRSFRDGEAGLLASDAILPNLAAETKRKAVYEIVNSLAENGYLDETVTAPITASLLHREDLASTGVGHGLAIPHTTHAAVPRPIVALARSRRGIDFDSLDGRSVRVLALVLCPADQPREQLRILATIARHFRDFDNRLRDAWSANAG